VLRKGEDTVPPHGDEVDEEELEPQGDNSKGQDLGSRPHLVVLDKGRHNLLLDLVRNRDLGSSDCVFGVLDKEFAQPPSWNVFFCASVGHAHEKALSRKHPRWAPR
jgi:hypothetical protein